MLCLLYFKEIDRLKRQIKNLEKEIEQYKEAIEYRDNFIAVRVENHE